MHWQIKVKQGSKTVDVYYYDPKEYQLEMRGCILWNRPNKAKQVFEAGVHDVSGWVRFEELMLRKSFYPILPVDNLEKLYYNPLKNPYWRRESDCGEFIWDHYEFDTLLTGGKQVYVLEERSSG
jgi:ASC-1-like (ASCH) protein